MKTRYTLLMTGWLCVIIGPLIAQQTPIQFNYAGVSLQQAPNVKVEYGDKIKITATGEIVVGMLAGRRTPNGVPEYSGNQYNTFRDKPHCALMVCVVEEGTEVSLGNYLNLGWEVCGSSYTFTAKKSGRLFFDINESVDWRWENRPVGNGFQISVTVPNRNKPSVSQPTISFNAPMLANQSVSAATFTVKACIQGQGVTTYQLYLNGEPVSSRGLRRGSACPNAVDESITLLPGKNTLYLTATNAGGTTTSDTRTITYNAPAVAVTAPKQQRLALVMGNAHYTHADELANPVNDALAMKSVLQECGFEVMYYTDLDKRGMATAFTDFGQKLRQYNVGFVFYAGHGVSVGGRNYFLPVDANPKTEDEVEFEGVETLRLIRKMEEANRLTNIMVLDACRDNPFARSWGRSLAESGGFALQSPPRGTFIAQSASEGQIASDRAQSGSNSPFTKALVKYIRQGGLSLTQILFRVRQAVEKETGGRQTTEDINKLTDDFYFR